MRTHQPTAPRIRSRDHWLAVVAAAALVAACLPAAPAAAQSPVIEAPGIPAPPIVGQSQAYELIPDLTAGQPAARGGFSWSHVIEVPGASFLKVHFVDVDLAPGERLIVRSASGRVVETITGRGPKGMKTFWGLSGRGDRMTLELTYRSAAADPPFRIDQVMVGDQDLLGGVPGGAGAESICTPADFEDVICYESDPVKWANVVASAGVMSVGGDPALSLFCSASNVASNNRLLTNEHCLNSQAECDSAEFVFRYWRTGCDDGSPATMDWVSYRCDEFLAVSPSLNCEASIGDLDFSLSSVIGDPASTFGWVEPDPVRLTDGEAIYIIQHPGGQPHEITHGSGADVDVDGTVLRYYNTLDTLGGSSGSPIFREADGKLVGLHHCGGCSTPGLGNRGMLMADIYPLIAPFLGSPAIFEDGFETGDTTAWDEVVN